ncbi:5567_t:CDS:1, partial [Entrophospora sp. SA101]
ARENYIVEVFYNKNTTYLSKPIPITKEEAIAQVSESKMTKQELIIKLESFLELMGENCRRKYRGFRSKNKSDLLIILQE